MKRIVFLRHSEFHNPGEGAAFSDPIAAKLVSSGVARYHIDDDPRPDALDVDQDSDPAELSGPGLYGPASERRDGQEPVVDAAVPVGQPEGQEPDQAEALHGSLSEPAGPTDRSDPAELSGSGLYGPASERRDGQEPVVDAAVPGGQPEGQEPDQAKALHGSLPEPAGPTDRPALVDPSGRELSAAEPTPDA